MWQLWNYILLVDRGIKERRIKYFSKDSRDKRKTERERERRKREFSKLETTRNTSFSLFRRRGREEKRKREGRGEKKGRFKGILVGERTEGTAEKAITTRLRKEEEEGEREARLPDSRLGWTVKVEAGKRGAVAAISPPRRNKDFSRPIVSGKAKILFSPPRFNRHSGPLTWIRPRTCTSSAIRDLSTYTTSDNDRP